LSPTSNLTRAAMSAATPPARPTASREHIDFLPSRKCQHEIGCPILNTHVAFRVGQHNLQSAHLDAARNWVPHPKRAHRGPRGQVLVRGVVGRLGCDSTSPALQPSTPAGPPAFDTLDLEPRRPFDASICYRIDIFGRTHSLVIPSSILPQGPNCQTIS